MLGYLTQKPRFDRLHDTFLRERFTMAVFIIFPKLETRFNAHYQNA